MRRSTSLILIVAFLAFLAVPLFAGDSQVFASGCGSKETKSSSASSKHSCSDAEKAACAAKGKVCPGMKTASAAEKLPNGHPRTTVADAQQCGSSTTAFLSVEKMTCDGCVSHVTKTLEGMDGVCAVDVSLKAASATVVFHDDEVSCEKMIAQVEKAGYKASLREISAEELKAIGKSKCANKSACSKSSTVKEASEI